MIRGATAQFKFKMPYSCDELAWMKVRFWQPTNPDPLAQITKVKDSHGVFSTNSEIVVTLTPEETILFSDKYKMKVQLRAMHTVTGTIFGMPPKLVTVYPKHGNITDEELQRIDVVSVALNVSEKSDMYVGDMFDLVATLSPANASNQGVKWISSADDIVVVSGNGLSAIIKAKAVGFANIIATTDDGGYTATCRVTVVNRTYTLDSNLVNVTTNSTIPSQISTGDSIVRYITSNDGFVLPKTIDVQNASYAWTPDTGYLNIYNPTGDVTVSITGNYEVSGWEVHRVIKQSELALAQLSSKYAGTAPTVPTHGAYSTDSSFRMSYVAFDIPCEAGCTYRVDYKLASGSTVSNVGVEVYNANCVTAVHNSYDFSEADREDLGWGASGFTFTPTSPYNGAEPKLMRITFKAGNGAAFDATDKVLEAVIWREVSLTDTPDAGTLRVMSYNVQRWRGINDNETMLSSIFNAYTPVIACFQEYDTNSSGDYDIGGTQPDIFIRGKWDNIVVGNDSRYSSGAAIKGFTLGIASNYKLSDPIYRRYRNFNYETRGYLKSYFTYDDVSIAVFTTHLEYTPKDVQYAEALALFSDVQAERYFILTGDFNTVCRSTADDDYINVIKLFVDAGYNCANCTADAGFLNTFTDGANASGAWEQTDNIITSPNIDIERVIVDETKLIAGTGLTIDHLPLIADLKLKASFAISYNLTGVLIDSPNPLMIARGGTVSIPLKTQDGYSLPAHVSVKGAQYNYERDKTTGVITLYDADRDVVVSVIAIENTYAINATLSHVIADANNVASVTPSEPVCLRFYPENGYWLPTSIGVTGAKYQWTVSDGCGTLELYSPFDDVRVEIAAIEDTSMYSTVIYIDSKEVKRFKHKKYSPDVSFTITTTGAEFSCGDDSYTFVSEADGFAGLVYDDRDWNINMSGKIYGWDSSDTIAEFTTWAWDVAADSVEPLKFYTLDCSGFTVNTIYAGISNVEYSYDGVSWTLSSLNVGNELIAPGGVIYLRGTNIAFGSHAGGGNNGINNRGIGMCFSKPVMCDGDLVSMLAYTGLVDEVDPRRFFGFFMDSTNLLRPPRLPSKTLYGMCYEALFCGCTSMVVNTEPSDGYSRAWRIPTTGRATVYDPSPLSSALRDTAGNAPETPEVGTTYYIKDDIS